MGDAAEDLDKPEPQEASKDQQKAIDELEQAQQQLEQVLEQLRRQQQEEILRGLESRFRAMLAKQLIINSGTRALDDKGREAWTHADELALAGHAQDEDGLARDAGEALHILKEEGTTIVFPQVVEQLREDMGDVAGRLRGRDTAAFTQRIEQEIVTTLEELIDAIKQLREQLQSGQSSGGGQQQAGQPPPLLPDSAELKLLRALQQRVNTRTEAFHETHGEQEEVSEELQGELDKLADRQLEVAEMARKMNERITGQ
jgi:hypothetical protein